MAKVYSLTDELKVPEFNSNWKQGLREKEAFVEIAKAWARKQNPNDTLAGEEYSIQHGDGYARYVVLSSKPVQLMHLPIGDAWDSPWADRVTKKDIIQEVERWKNVTPIFGKST